MVGQPGPVFEELVAEFADALDAWSHKVKGVLNGRPQKVLANGLNANQGNVSRWLSGRDQIWKGQAALPGVGLTRDILRVLQLNGPDADLLLQLADRVDELQKPLMEHKGWRKRAADHLQSSPDSEGRPDSALPAAVSTSESTAVVLSAPPGIPRRNPGRRSWRDRPSWVKASWGGSLTVVVAAAAVIVAAAVGRTGGDGKSGDGPEAAGPRSSASSHVSSAAQGGPVAVGSEAPGLEKGTLGVDSRCSAPFPGPGAVVWRVCARVEAERVSFALKITNNGNKAAAVKVRLQYARAEVFYPCPNAPDAHVLSIPAGMSVITDSGQCAGTREDSPFAYQGVGWVLPEGATDGSYKLSPAAHVYPTRVIWQPDLV
ncbi:hypothetical protein ABZZ20_30650 [Streptomyces sp. NPDC006430]|uniref:hypothetical protein n=1 Tax=Streptomyces sp. NPDC006430 TaxID=3154299 RepID=UPI0033AF9E41